jgi:DNA-binding NarL/FixJ family response regulator
MHTQKPTVKIIIVEDHTVISETFRDRINKEMHGFEVIGIVASGQELLRTLNGIKPDIVLLDTMFPSEKKDGFDTAKELREKFGSSIKIVFFTQVFLSVDVKKFINEHGIEGFIHKTASVSDLEALLNKVAGGEKVIVKETNRVLQKPNSPTTKLTKTEIEILRWYAKGKRSREIAKIRGCEQSAVETHSRNIREKLGVNTIAQAMVIATKLGMLDDLED